MYTPDILQIYSRYTPDILLAYAPDIAQIYSRYTTNIPVIDTPDIHQIYPKYISDIPHMSVEKKRNERKYHDIRYNSKIQKLKRI